MTDKDYINYLLELTGAERQENPEEDNLFGLFEHFRPDGDGINKVFSPVPQNEEYIRRLMEVYKATEKGDPERAYFIVDHPVVLKKEEVVTLGEKLIENLRIFSRKMAEQEETHNTRSVYVESEEFVTLVEALNKVVILEEGEFLDLETDEYYAVSETISDWMIEHAWPKGLIDCLGEAYYSIACDYWIRYYLEWPRYSHLIPTDIFKPYFELWKSNLRFSIFENSLIIGKQGN